MNGTLLRLLDEVAGREEPHGHTGRGGDHGDHGNGNGGGGGASDDAALILAAEESMGTPPFRLPLEESDRLRLAYACSVHRGQGIELPIAIIVAHPAAGAFFLRREMLYTAVTRARIATVIVGVREVVARAVRTPDTGRRHGRLAERLQAIESGRPRSPSSSRGGSVDSRRDGR
jgi:exodeoxyribonuclease V alpha subunit